jgi:hypothetical protein
MTDDDDLAERQTQAHIQILHVLRDFNLVEVPDIAPVVAALTASMLMRVPWLERTRVEDDLRLYIESLLRTAPAGLVSDHDA